MSSDPVPITPADIWQVSDPPAVSRPWRAIIEQLAGPGAAIQVGELSGSVIVDGPLGHVTVRGRDQAHALRAVAHIVAQARLTVSLQDAGWAIVDDVIDEVTYVVAQDPEGVRWAIGVATSGDDSLEPYLESWMAMERRVRRRAIVDLLETRDAAALMAALALVSGGLEPGP